MTRVRLFLMVVFAAACLAWAPTASASSVTSTGIALFHGAPYTPLSDVVAGWQGGLQVWFTPATATGGGNIVTITGPAGTAFNPSLTTTGNNTMTDVTDDPGASANATVTGVTDGGRTVTIEVPGSINVTAGQTLRVNLSIVHSLVSFGTLAGPKKMQVSTSNDTTPVDTPEYRVMAAAPATVIAVDGEQSTALNQNFKPMHVGLEDTYGNPASGQQVTAAVAASGASGTFPGGQSSASVETGANGEVVLPTVQANDILGPWELDLEGPGDIHAIYGMENLVHAEPAAVGLTLAPATVAANGASGLTATASVTDEFGNPIPGEELAFTSTGAQLIGPVTDNGDGTYEAVITASTIAGQSTVTATDSSPAIPLSDSAILTQTSLLAKTIELTLLPTAIPADGKTTATARAVVRDSLGNTVPGAQLKFTSSGEQKFSPVKVAGQGVYTTTVTAGRTAGISEITVAVVDTSPTVSAKASLTQSAPIKAAKPKLKFVSPPKKKTRAAKVKFRFKVVKGEARGFQCRLDRKKWKKCKSPKKVKLKPGKHVFKVRGIATDGSFGKPIVRKIKRIAR